MIIQGQAIWPVYLLDVWCMQSLPLEQYELLWQDLLSPPLELATCKEKERK